MASLNQGAVYPVQCVYGYHSIPNIPITGAPADADLTRWAMLHDGTDYLLYCFKAGSNDTLYAFGWNFASYQYGHHCSPQYTLVDAPADTDFRSIAMLHSGANYHAYFHSANEPTIIYQLVLIPTTTTFKWKYANFSDKFTISGFPADTDWTRWDMLHDNVDYRIFAFKQGANNTLYQGAFNNSTLDYEHGHRSNPVLELVDYPASSDYRSSTMLHDGSYTRLYFQATGTAVPSVVGLAEPEAIQVLQAAGFTVTTSPHTVGPFDPDNVVLEQTPEPGSLAQPGSNVALVISLAVPS